VWLDGRQQKPKCHRNGTNPAPGFSTWGHGDADGPPSDPPLPRGGGLGGGRANPCPSGGKIDVATSRGMLRSSDQGATPSAEAHGSRSSRPSTASWRRWMSVTESDRDQSTTVVSGQGGPGSCLDVRVFRDRRFARLRRRRPCVDDESVERRTSTPVSSPAGPNRNELPKRLRAYRRWLMRNGRRRFAPLWSVRLSVC